MLLTITTTHRPATIVLTTVNRECNEDATCPAGAVGVIVRAPADIQHSYRIRLPGGEEVSLRRDELQPLKHFQAEGITAGPAAGDSMAECDLHQHVIYRCIVGSRAYGLDHADSDTDRRGVYLPPAEMHWSLFGVPEQLAGG